ncbi:MAG: class II glutamine amidotransferase [bacterium]|nr:class II glutamine amidotransferase [bacterium]
MSNATWSRAEQIALSFDGPTSPSVALRGQRDGQADLLPQRWGVGWYADNHRSISIVRDDDLPAGTSLAHFLDQWGDPTTSLMLGLADGFRDEASNADDGQPFTKSYAGRNWLLSFVGSLDPTIKVDLALDEEAFDIAPVGASPAEHAFCWLIAEMRAAGAKTIDEFGWRLLLDAFRKVNQFGPASFIFTDGIDLVAYRDEQDRVPLYWTRRVPPHEHQTLDGRAFRIGHDGPLDASRTVLALSTLPMRGSRWTPLEASELRVVRGAQTVWSSHPVGIDEHNFTRIGQPKVAALNLEDALVPGSSQQQQAFVADPAPDLSPIESSDTPSATLSIVHETRFTYSEEVERSSHRFCLRPVRDEHQHILDYELEVNVDAVAREYEDVFGNLTRQLEVAKPYTEMVITSRATVHVEGIIASHLKTPLRRDQIPLVWMPWQRQMMQAYLMPPELPEPELRELSDFAMSFVERNDYDLVETLLDMNRTIYRDFTYVPGATTVETTPFQVYATRKGVCQDFANVLICIARLLGVPARYRVGYIYTGGSYENKIQSDASHAWAEVFLPWTGWVGLDPTNGCLASADHVKVACGRNYRDAAPTTGTIYRGGGIETLSVDVRVERLEPED